MLKKKFYLKDMDLGFEAGENGFTDESYVIVDIPSLNEKVQIKRKFDESKDGMAESDAMAMLSGLVVEVNCIAIDDSEEIKDFETLSCYAVGEKLIIWLGELTKNGFMPKKMLTV